MNRKLPFEKALQQQLTNLPVPDEDRSWQQMSRLLDREEKRRPGGFFLTWGFLLLLGVLQLLEVPLAVRYQTLSRKEPLLGSPPHQGSLSAPQPVNTAPLASQNITQPQTPNTSPLLTPILKTPEQQTAAPVPETDSPVSAPGPAENRFTSGLALLKQNKLYRPEKMSLLNTVLHAPTKRSEQGTGKRPELSSSSPDDHGTLTASHLDSTPASENFTRRSDGSVRREPSPVPISRTLRERAPVSLLADGQPIPVDAPARQLHIPDSLRPIETPPVKIAPSLKKYRMSAGISLRQQLPLSGQKTLVYDYQGKRNLATDYIPGVYFRLERVDKWFLQGEFYYAAPALLKDYAYSQQTGADSALNRVTSRMNLKKVFYTQLPLSFNYYLRPQWSVGAGGVYNLFRGAITEQEIITSRAQTQSVSVERKIVPVTRYTDSFLYRSHTFVMLQTQYAWRRFSIELRYTKDIQPYIRYTMPDGTVTGRKNWSVDGILRFRLWQSKKF